MNNALGDPLLDTTRHQRPTPDAAGTREPAPRPRQPRPGRTPEQPHGSNPATPAKGFAVTALVTGIIGVVFGLIPLLALIALPLGIVALVFGLIAARRNKIVGAGVGMARAGWILGAIATTLAVAGFVIVNSAVDDLGDSVEDGMVARAEAQPADSASGGTPDAPALDAAAASDLADPDPAGAPADMADDVLPLGTVAAVGDWDVAITSITRNDAVQPYEAEPGVAYVGYVVRVDGTYNGEDTGDLSFGLSLRYVGSDDRVYADFDSYMTDFEQDTLSTPAVVAGGTQTHEFTLAVPEGANGNTTIGLEPLFSLGDDFALWTFTP